jgi:pilus assembly protein FimV
LASAVAPVAAPTPPPAPAPAPAAAPASAPGLVAKPAAVPTADAGPLDGLLDSPYLLYGLGGVAALLGLFGVYRWRSRASAESGETSFLESRLQPDSFFGASGGQRIDTRDASGASSSMSYSLSQLDAIGDVDPVAEADVYLAYGRDLQAEEILKEAMRSSPDRLAIRSKLLEVYAKRRDTKGYELLATQLFGLTGGEGDDWHKAQQLGQQIDPENPLYQPGGRPSTVMQDGRMAVVEALGASTMPQSVMPPNTLGFAPSDVPSVDAGADVDLDLDLVAAAPAPAPVPLESTQPLPSLEGLPAAKAGDSKAMEFDLGGISLDLGTSAKADDAFDSTQGGAASTGGAIDAADPLLRKLELAEEFRQIGDMEGARDLLEEVIAKAGGPLKARAQSLLDGLG